MLLSELSYCLHNGCLSEIGGDDNPWLSLLGPPVVNGQFLAVGCQWCRVRPYNCPGCKALADLSIRNDSLYDRPKRCGRPLIFMDVILPISDTLFDSSQAQRLQNQSVYTEVVYRLRLYRSFPSLCYRRSSLGKAGSWQGLASFPGCVRPRNPLGAF